MHRMLNLRDERIKKVHQGEGPGGCRIRGLCQEPNLNEDDKRKARRRTNTDDVDCRGYGGILL